MGGVSQQVEQEPLGKGGLRAASGPRQGLGRRAYGLRLPSLVAFGVFALALPGACDRRGRGAEAPAAKAEPPLSPSEKSLARAEDGARRAHEAATEHARLAKAIEDRLPEGKARDKNLQLLQAAQETVRRSAADAEEAVSRARLLIGFDRLGGPNSHMNQDEIGRLADRAELDATELERRQQVLAKALAKLEQQEPASPTPGESVDAKSCANGAITCSAPTPYCCKHLNADYESDGGGQCVAARGDCQSDKLACKSDADCPPGDANSNLEGCPPESGECWYTFRHSEQEQRASAKFTEEYNESLNCGSVVDCDRFCRRDLKGHPNLLSSACTRLIDAAEQLINGSEGPTSVARGAAIAAKHCDAEPLPAGGARPAQAKACEMAAWAYNSSRDVNRNLALAARYYERAYKLSGDGRDFRGAFEMTCAVETWSARRREPDMDEWCNHGVPRRRWATLAYSPEDPRRRFEYDECSEAMRNVGCTGVNVGRAAGIRLPKGQELKSAYCCRGARP